MKTNMKHKQVCKTYPTLDIKKIVLKTSQISIDQLGMTVRYALKKISSLVTTVYISQNDSYENYAKQKMRARTEPKLVGQHHIDLKYLHVYHILIQILVHICNNKFECEDNDSDRKYCDIQEPCTGVSKCKLSLRYATHLFLKYYDTKIPN